MKKLRLSFKRDIYMVECKKCQEFDSSEEEKCSNRHSLEEAVLPKYVKTTEDGFHIFTNSKETMFVTAYNYREGFNEINSENVVHSMGHPELLDYYLKKDLDLTKIKPMDLA